MFSEFHGLNRILCSNARAVAQKQRQVLEKLNKVTFSQNEIYPATEFSGVVFSGVLVFSVLYYRDKSLCFNARAVAQQE